jgi:hypothetical protein|tara:strand:+ start:117 stop:530 length:414 start_codon:yes stop_codon:yes gene_type:complete
MVGYTKECKICGCNFTTRSAKSARWEFKCMDCHAGRKRTIAENRQQKMVLNAEASLRKDIDKLEAKVSDIDMLIAAEISNHLNKIVEADMVKEMTDAVLELVATKVAEMEEKLTSFQEKIQRQIVTLSNRMSSLVKE